MDNIDEFGTIENKKDRIEFKIKSGYGRMYYIEDMGEIVSLAQTTAESNKAAMVVGVATKKSHRNKGLVKKCLSKLLNDLLNGGKRATLFYSNPVAGSMYKGLGFEKVGDYIIVAR